MEEVETEKNNKYLGNEEESMHHQMENNENSFREIKKEEMKPAELNKCINNVKALLSDALRKSQHLRFEGMYEEVFKKMEAEKLNEDKKQRLTKQQSFKRVLNEGKNLGILEYDFLKPNNPSNANKKGIKQSRSLMSAKSARSQKSGKSNMSPDNSPSRSPKIELKKSPTKAQLMQEIEDGFNLNMNKKSSKMLGSASTNAMSNPLYNRYDKYLKPKKPKTKKFPLSVFLNQPKEESKIDESIINTNTYVQTTQGNEKKDLYQRNLVKKMKLEKYLTNKRNEKLQEEDKHMQNKPVISKNSKKIINEKFREVKPIYNRLHEIIEKKNTRVSSMKRVVKYENDQKLFKDQANKVRKDFSLNQSISYDPNRFNNWLQEKKEWTIKKADKVIRMKEQYQEIENEDHELTFKPKLNSVSKKLTKNRSTGNINAMNTSLLVDRLHNEYFEKLLRKNDMVLKSFPSFKPKINNKIPSYVKSTRSLIDNVFVDKTLDRKFFGNEDDDYIIPQKDNDDSNIGQNQQFPYSNSFKSFNPNANTNANADSTANFNSSANHVNAQGEMNAKSNKSQHHPAPHKPPLKINENLYRINVRDASIWDKNKENNIMYNPEYDFVLKKEL